mmetsp:Transcript_44844/g.75437  ORF Transcript_44844/g.75437 Transcript_44844/m.75437 type:complete len:80 (-) Transcript_44844:445-684(-)
MPLRCTVDPDTRTPAANLRQKWAPEVNIVHIGQPGSAGPTRYTDGGNVAQKARKHTKAKKVRSEQSAALIALIEAAQSA